MFLIQHSEQALVTDPKSSTSVILYIELYIVLQMLMISGQSPV